MGLKGKVTTIKTSEKRGVIISKDEVLLKENFGIIGDAHAGKGNKQISLLGTETMEKMGKINIKGLCNVKFVENLTIEGIDLYKLSVGTRFKIGETIQEVTQIGKKCYDGCPIKEKIGPCVLPKEVVFTKVVKGGKVRKGDIIEAVE